MGAPFSKHLLPEVLVGRDRYPLLVICLAKDVGILRSSRRFVHREDLVPFLSQPMRNGGAHTFVHQKTHLRRLDGKGNECGVFECSCGEEDAGQDVFPGDAWIFFHDRLDAFAVGEQVENMLHRQPGSPDDCFPRHDFGIQGDAFQRASFFHRLPPEKRGSFAGRDGSAQSVPSSKRARRFIRLASVTERVVSMRTTLRRRVGRDKRRRPCCGVRGAGKCSRDDTDPAAVPFRGRSRVCRCVPVMNDS